MPGRGSSLAERLIALGDELVDPSSSACGWMHIGLDRLASGDGIGATDAFLTEALLADQAGDPLRRADARWRLAGMAANRGELVEAAEFMAEAGRIEANARDGGERLVGLGLHFVMARNTGRLGDLAPFVGGIGERASALPAMVTAEGAIAMVLLAAGKPQRACALMKDLPRRPFLGGSHVWRTATCLSADVALGLGDLEAMTSLATSLQPSLGQVAVIPGVSAVYALVDDVVGRIALAIGDVERAHGLFDSARSYYRLLGAAPLVDQVERLLALALGDLPADPAARARFIASVAGCASLPD